MITMARSLTTAIEKELKSFDTRTDLNIKFNQWCKPKYIYKGLIVLNENQNQTNQPYIQLR
jgi:hypothetical protein